MLPLHRQMLCVLRVAGPQLCPVQATTGRQLTLPLLPIKFSSGGETLRCLVPEGSWPLLHVEINAGSGGETCLALSRGQLAGLTTRCNAFLQCSETAALKKTDIGGYKFVTNATHMLPGVGKRKRLMEHILDMTTQYKFTCCEIFGSRAKTSGGIAPCASPSGGSKMTFQ